MYVSLDYMNMLPTENETSRSRYLKAVAGIEPDKRLYPHTLNTLNKRLGINAALDTDIFFAKGNIELVFAVGNGLYENPVPNPVELLQTVEAPASVRFGTNATFGSGKDLANIIPLRSFIASNQNQEELNFRLYKAYKQASRWKRQYWTKKASHSFLKTDRPDGYPIWVLSVRCVLHKSDFEFTQQDIDANQCSFNEICIYAGKKINTHEIESGPTVTDPSYLQLPSPKTDIISVLPIMSGYFAPIDFRSIPPNGIEMQFNIIVKDSSPVVSPPTETPGGGNNGIGGITVDLIALNAALTNAENVRTTVTVSADGSDVLQGNLWVTQALIDQYDADVDNIRIERDNIVQAGEANDKDQNYVDNLVSSLVTIVGEFENARSVGSMPPSAPDITALDAKIAEANGNLTATEISIDGSDVEDTKFWTTQIVRDALVNLVNTGLAAVNDVNTNGSSTLCTQTQIDSILSDLEAGIIVFNGAKQQGTLVQPSPQPPNLIALAARIQQATDLLANTVKSIDGSDVGISDFWVTELVWDTLDGDRGTIQQELDDIVAAGASTDKNQSYVDNLEQLMYASIDVFNQTRSNGTMSSGPARDTSILTQTILSATTLLNDTSVSVVNGSDVDTTAYWTNQATWDQFNVAINEATARLTEFNDPGNTEDQVAVDAAVSTLNSDVSIFRSIRALGTMTP